MKTLIREIGVIDKPGNKHPVYFKKELNVFSRGYFRPRGDVKSLVNETDRGNKVRVC